LRELITFLISFVVAGIGFIFGEVVGIASVIYFVTLF
jgi:hypothetical protein